MATNTLWGTAGRLFGGFFAFFSLAFISRTLGTDGYGQYATILAFLYLFNAVADGGFYNILARDIGRPNVDAPKLVATALTLRSVTLLCSLVTGLVVFFLIPKYHSLAPLAPLAVVSYAALSFGQLLMAVLQKHLIVQRAAAAEVLARFFQLLASAGLYALKVRSVFAFLIVLAAVSILQFGMIFKAARRVVPFRFGATRQDAGAMFRESFPVALALLFTTVYFRLDTVLLSLLQGPKEVGIYNLSYKLLEQLIFFPAMFVGILTPILARAFSEGTGSFEALFRRANHAIAFFAFPVFVGGWFLAPSLALLLGGEAFGAASQPMRVLFGATTLIFFGTLLGVSVIVAGLQKKALVVYAIAMAVNIAGNLFFIPRFSYMGSAWVTLFTEAIVDLGLMIILWRSSVRFEIPRLFRIAGASAAMAVPLFFFVQSVEARLGLWSLALFLPSCAVIYFGFAFLLRAISRQDAAVLFRRG